MVVLKGKLISLAENNKSKNDLVRSQRYDKAAAIKESEKRLIEELCVHPLINEDNLKLMVGLFSDGEDGWSVVAIMAHNGAEPEPMKPITMMRNALGASEGGNGVSIDKKKYEKSVEFWKKHVSVKS